MGKEAITKNNFALFAMQNYNNPGCSEIEEFQEDLNRIKYIKRLFCRYETKGILKHRLLLNHIIILQNLFGAAATARILFFKIEEEYHSYLKTFLYYLGYLPVEIPEANLHEIPLDHKVHYILEQLQ